MSERRVEYAAAIIFVRPGDRTKIDAILTLLFSPICSGLERVVVELQQVAEVLGARRVEFIPLVGEDEAFGESIHTGEIGFDDLQRSGLHRGMNVKHVTDHFGIPIPLIFGIGGAVDAHETLARLHEAFERPLLRLVEDIAGGEEEDDDIVVGEPFVVHDTVHVVAPKNLEIVELGQTLQRDDTGGSGIVVPAIRLGDEQGLKLGGSERGGDQE